MELKFWQCPKCGKIVAVVQPSKCNMLACCNQPMVEVTANTTDAAVEKHVPEYTVNGNIVDVVVGSVEHPMMEEHYIKWILVQTNQGNQRKELTPGSAPKASFALLPGEKVEAVYAYCNLHGLWKK